MREFTEDDIRYGPDLCPGCNLCSHCREQRNEIAEYVAALKKKIKKVKSLEKKVKRLEDEINRIADTP